MFAKKSVELLQQDASEFNTPSLERSLGLFALIALGIGSIVGVGIFVITGQVAANYTGPSIVLSFVLAALGCACVGLCYAEFASLIPVAGSAYTYAYATLGELLAWIVGWDLALEYLLSASTVSVGWSGYLVSLLHDVGITLPPKLSQAPCNLPAMGLVGLMTGLLVMGIRKSTQFNNIIVVVKLVAIFLFIGFGIFCISPQNWLPFIPENTGEFGVFGWSGVVRGSGIIFFAYIGFDALATVTQEAYKPQRDIPIAMLVSLLISTILYIGVALVLTGIVPYKLLNVPDPIAVGVNAMGIRFVWLRLVVKIAAIAGLSSVVLVSLMAQARVLYSMGKDGLLPALFTQVHPQFKTPYVATIISGAIAMVLAGVLPLEVLAELVSIGTLLAFLIVVIAVLVLRHTQPDLHRPFRTPFAPWIPLLGALISGGQMLSFSLNSWLRLLGWLLIGLIIYFAYGRTQSVLYRTNKQVTEPVKE
ncbi:MAG: amino acid permease [Cyanomargarita calcarea GSE-NOS-MK-12-04C]|uniref:Amino acid permease n=1 Tax=Cyanomargarita calcarea GSE-NOS-MK-12-04C TaxID=2839659 RepID=A0A951URD6_9CYAN|nr:amino acid permease [Cyanomargarita calcarea GSE-NOS-MK-12-04C]